MIDKTLRKATAERHGPVVVVRYIGGFDCLWLNMYLDCKYGQMTCDSDIGSYSYKWYRCADNGDDFIRFCTKWLANEEAKIVAVIGPGVMSRFTLDAFMCARPKIDTLKIKGRGMESLNNFINWAKNKYPQIKNYIICDSLEEACRESDIIFYGTTNAAKYEDNPYVEEAWIKPGAVIIAASALLVKTDFLAKDNVKLVADNYAMYAGWGEGRELPTQKTVSTLLGMGFYDAVTEGKIARESIIELGDIINGKVKARDNKDQIMVYAVGGMSLEDVAWGYECYQNALKNNIGVKLNLWETPELMK